MQSWPVRRHVRDNRLGVLINSNKTLSGLLFLALTFPALGRVVITPGAPIVPAGASVKLRANTDVQWSLSPGSVGTIDADGTYHAPRSVGAKNAVGGCQVLPNDHIFNTRIDALPTDQNSPTWIQSIPPSAVTYLPSWGITIADKTTPKKRMHFFYTPQYDGVFDLPEWPILKQENGVFADPLSDLDRHILVVNKDDCIFSEFYKANPKGLNKACPECTAQSGVHYQGMTYELLHGSADAAGLPITPLTLRLDEILSGVIRHALRVTLTNSLIHASSVWPGSSHASPWGKIPYGTRFRLRKDIDISRFSPIAKILITQLKEYGFVLADGGANWEVDIATDVTESPEVMAAFNEVHSSGITSRDFEVVNEAPLMISAESGRVRPDNTYVKPDDYAVVLAQNALKPTDRAELPIAIEAPTIGMPNPAIWIQSGVSKELEAWVRGAVSQRITWKADPSLGSISADGLYNAPDVAAPKTAMITASLDSDPASRLPLLVTVIPKGPIRIDVGNATNAPGTPHSHAPDYGPDSKGHMWWREMGGEYPYGVSADNWYGLPWPKIPDIGLYYTNRYTLGDMLYRFLVPNGNYKITAMYAFPCKGTYQAKYEAPMHFEAQRRLIAKEFDWGAANGHACVTPSIFEMPATVKDNSLEFALRRVTHGDLIPASGMNAFSIEPDAEPPHLAVDPPHPSDVSAGQKLQFRAVGWFMADAVTWSLEGPGSIDQNGIYTAPATPAGNSQRVVVAARSTIDKSKTASAAFSFKFGELSISPTEAVLGRGLEQQFAIDLTGVPYRNVTWSLSPAVGSIDSAGTYRAPDDIQDDTDVTVSASSRDVAGKVVSAKVRVKAIPNPIRINCGDQGGFRDAKGNEWIGDFGYSPSTGYHVDNVVIKNATQDMQYLYRSARYRYANESFFYNFQLPNGMYNVTLLFADYSHDKPVQNYFDVKLNDKPVLTRFNPTEIVGGQAAITKQFSVGVTSRNLRIDFVGDGGNAYISGIEIVYSGPLR